MEILKIHHIIFNFNLLFYVLKRKWIMKDLRVSLAFAEDGVEIWKNKIEKIMQRGKPVSQKKKDSLEKFEYLVAERQDLIVSMESYSPSFQEVVMDKVNIKWVMKNYWKSNINGIPYYERMTVFLQLFGFSESTFEENKDAIVSSLKL